jgi:glutamyl-tRNA reductase
VSISSAAVEFSKDACPRDLKKSLAETRVVIVGAGNMTKLLIAHLKSQGVNEITLVSRGVGPKSNAAEVVEQHPDIKWNLRGSCELYDALNQCDLAFFSTSATKVLLTADGLKEHLGTRNLLTKPLLIVDISVPRNVDAPVGEVPGCHVYNVDHLKDAVARNTANRRLEMLEAEALLKEELCRYQGWHQSLGVVPKILKLQETAEQIRIDETNKHLSKLKNLSDKELDVIGRLTKGIVSKLLHSPLSHLRAIEDMESKQRTLSTFSALFKLDDTDK